MIAGQIEQREINKLETARVNDNAIICCTPGEIHTAHEAYTRGMTLTALTPQQAAVASRYAALAEKCCARAGLHAQALQLQAAQWGYIDQLTAIPLSH